MGGVSIGLSTSHTLDFTANTTDVTTKDSAGEYGEIAVTSKGWTVTTENLVSIGSDGKSTAEVFDAGLAGTKVTVLFGLVTPQNAAVPTGGFTVDTTTTGRFAYQGDAYITAFNLTANNGEFATARATFTGTGALTKVQPESQQNTQVNDGGRGVLTDAAEVEPTEAVEEGDR